MSEEIILSGKAVELNDEEEESMDSDEDSEAGEKWFVFLYFHYQSNGSKIYRSE